MREKKGFLSHRGHKTAVAVVSDFGSGCFDCSGVNGAMALRCQWWGSCVSEEEEELRDLEVVEKVRVMGGSGMIIGEILCLFLLRKLPILLVPTSFSPFRG